MLISNFFVHMGLKSELSILFLPSERSLDLISVMEQTKSNLVSSSCCLISANHVM